MGKIIPILFFIYLGMPVMSGLWKLKKESNKACRNLDGHKLAEILYISESYYNNYTTSEVKTNLISLLIEQYIQHNKKVNFCIFTLLLAKLCPKVFLSMNISIY